MSDLKPPDDDAFHRFTSRLAALDLDPATIEMLTAVLTIDLTEATPEASPRPAG
jgi:hypothetical protein